MMHIRIHMSARGGAQESAQQQRSQYWSLDHSTAREQLSASASTGWRPASHKDMPDLSQLCQYEEEHLAQTWSRELQYSAQPVTPLSAVKHSLGAGSHLPLLQVPPGAQACVQEPQCPGSFWVSPQDVAASRTGPASRGVSLESPSPGGLVELSRSGGSCSVSATHTSLRHCRSRDSIPLVRA
jgi:hypothetical protein